MWVVGVEVTMVLIFRNGAEPRGAGSSCSEPSRTQSLARWASGFPPHPPLLLPGGNQAATPTPMRSSALSCCGFNFSPTLQMPRDPGGSPEGPTDCSAPRPLPPGPWEEAPAAVLAQVGLVSPGLLEKQLQELQT